jgi:hypothetical protein
VQVGPREASPGVNLGGGADLDARVDPRPLPLAVRAEVQDLHAAGRVVLADDIRVPVHEVRQFLGQVRVHPVQHVEQRAGRVHLVRHVEHAAVGRGEGALRHLALDPGGAPGLAGLDDDQAHRAFGGLLLGDHPGDTLLARAARAVQRHELALLADDLQALGGEHALRDAAQLGKLFLLRCHSVPLTRMQPFSALPGPG